MALFGTHTQHELRDGVQAFLYPLKLNFKPVCLQVVAYDAAANAGRRIEVLTEERGRGETRDGRSSSANYFKFRKINARCFKVLSKYS